MARHLLEDELKVGIVAEIGRFAALAGEVSEDDQWKLRTRFWGLAVGDVVAHVTGVLADVTSGRVTNLVTPAAVARQVIERLPVGRASLVKDLWNLQRTAESILSTFTAESWAAPAPSGFDGTIAEAVQAIWEDIWLHADDIRSAVGAEPDLGPGLAASVYHVIGRLERSGWNGAITLDGLGEIVVGGGGRAFTADPHTFVLVATSRADPLEHALDPSLVIET